MSDTVAIIVLVVFVFEFGRWIGYGQGQIARTK